MERKVAKANISLKWKDFKLDMETVEAWMRANAGEHYCGNQAAASLEIWFDEEPGQEVRDAIQAYWDGIKKTHAVAKNYVSKEDIEAAKKAAKEDALTKPWDQLNVAQRKLLMGMDPNKDDLDL